MSDYSQAVSVEIMSLVAQSCSHHAWAEADFINAHHFLSEEPCPAKALMIVCRRDMLLLSHLSDSDLSRERAEEQSWVAGIQARSSHSLPFRAGNLS